MTRIKICGITRAEDALAAAQCGADAIGLVFYAKSPRHVSMPRPNNWLGALPPFVTVVGLFVDAEAAFVREVLANVPLDLLQFHGDETPEFCAQFDRPYIKAIRVKAGVDLLQCASDFHDAKGLLLDAHVEGIPGGTGSPIRLGIDPAAVAAAGDPVRRADAENVAAAIRQVRPYAVDVSSGVEAVAWKPARESRTRRRSPRSSRRSSEMTDCITFPTAPATSAPTAACSSPRR